MSRRVPREMRDRWANRPDLRDDQFSLYWHVLLGDDDGVRKTARTVQDRVAHLPGLHFTPSDWLHVTVEALGVVEARDPDVASALSAAVREELRSVPSFHTSLQNVLYHPEAVVLEVHSPTDMHALRGRVRDAVRAVLGDAQLSGAERWVPHLTVAYSTMEQPSAPLVAALGHDVEPCRFRIDKLSLVQQWGPERHWSWRVVDEVTLR